MSIESKVKQIIVSSIKGLDESKITGDSTLDKLGADSLDSVEIIMSIEQEFKINITEDDFEALQTVDNIINYLKDKGFE
jgi:acyl carrier protein